MSAGDSLLGQIIQKAAGRSFLKFTSDTVFKRLNMNVAGDFPLLLFRFSPPKDVKVEGTPNLTRNVGAAAAGTMSGRRSDEQFKRDMLVYLTMGIPAESDYMTLAPGWKVCRSGDETMMMANGAIPSGFVASMSVFPKEKAVFVLLWKLGPGSDPSSLADERQQVVVKAMGMPTPNWDCGP